MSNGLPPNLQDSTEAFICEECRGDAHRFILGVQEAWTREDFCDAAFMYTLAWLAGDIVRAIESNPENFEPDKRKYYSRKLLEAGIAIMGDVQ